MELVPWKYELARPIVTFAETSGVFLFSLLLLLVANTFFIGLNTHRLGWACAISFFYFTYFSIDGVHMAYLFLAGLLSYPQNALFIFSIITPPVVGYALNKAIVPTPKATRYILHSLRSISQTIVLRFGGRL